MAVESVEIVLNGVDNATPVMDKVTQKLVDNENKYISKLKEQLIAQTQGAEAAEQFKLAEMGFSEETQKAAAAIRDQIEAVKSHQAEIDKAQSKTEKSGKSAESVLASIGLEAGGFGDYLVDFEGIADTLESMSPRLAGIAGTLKTLAPAALGFATAWASLEVGKQLGDWLFGATQFREELERTSRQINEMRQQETEKKKTGFENDIAVAGIAIDDDTRNRQLDEVQARIQRNMELEAQGVQDQIAYVNQLREEYANAASIDRAALEQNLAIAVNDLESRTAGLQELTDQQRDLTEQRQREAAITSASNQVEQQKAINEYIKSTREEAAQFNQEGESMEARHAREAQQLKEMLANTENLRYSDKAVAELALEKRQQAEREAAARKEALETVEETRKKLEEQNQINNDYLQGLQLQNTELTKGKRAAEELKAEFAGVSKETIEQGREMAIQNELLQAQKQLTDEQKKKDEERQKALAVPTAPLQAMQSRLLSRVSTGGGDRVAKATEKTAELTAEIERLQREQLDLQKRRGITELAVVEG